MFQLDAAAIARQILPREQCRQLTDTVFTVLPHPDYKNIAIRQAEEIVTKPLNVLPLTEYLSFSRDGNRSRYESVYFERRNRLLKLLLGELAAGKQGRFVPAVMDTLWAILEETTWVIPAHNLCFETNQSAPHEFHLVRHVDLFSAATAATVSLAVWHLEEQFETAMPKFFMEKFHLEMNRRIFEPYCSDVTGGFMDWKGLKGNYVNNWNPWIGLSCSIAALFGEPDETLRKTVCQKALEYVNNWLKFIPENGTCLEGANYYFPSNGAFWDLLELLRVATDGKANFREHPFVRSLVCSISEFYMGGGRWAPIADCSTAKVGIERAVWLSRTGKALGSDALNRMALESWQATGTDTAHLPSGNISYFPLRALQTWCEGPNRFEEAPPFADTCTFNPANEHFICRKGDFTFRLKGGHNHEPHGHNDVGEFILYYKGQPVFIDPAHQTYCADTFNENRYSLWYNRSDWHNTPVIGGVVQQEGPQLLHIPLEKTATEVVANASQGWAKMELKEVYPAQSGILSLTRRAEVTNGFSITDRFVLEKENEYAFHLISLIPPQVEGNRLIFTLSDRNLICEFSEGYAVQTEEVVYNDRVMQSAWDQDRLYRTKITATAKEDVFAFVMQI